MWLFFSSLLAHQPHGSWLPLACPSSSSHHASSLVARSLLVACSQPHKTQNEDKFLIFEASKKVLHLNYLRHFSSSLTGCWASRRAADEPAGGCNAVLLIMPVIYFHLAYFYLLAYPTFKVFLI
jgi:hypothetical protein